VNGALRLGTALVLGAALFVVGGVGALGPRSAPSTEPPLPVATAETLTSPTVRGGSLETIIAGLQARLRDRPEDAGSLAALGLAYVQQARITADPSYYPKAEEALERSLALVPDGNADALVGLGALDLARHAFADALTWGRRAVAADPYDANARGVVGDALLELGRYRQAFRAFQAMVDTRPDIASYARVSYARELRGDVNGAIEAMELALSAAGTPADAAWASYQLGELEFGRGDVRSAASRYERGLELDATYVPNLAGLARVTWARGDVDRALERYRDVVERYPSVEHVAALGDLYATLGRDGLAAEQYAVVEATRAIARANGVNVDLEVALFDADHGDPVSALAAAEAEWARRKGVHVADAYAWALYANGRYDEAARISRRALALGTRNALFLFHAGMIELARGRDDAARRLLREAIATNPHFSILHAATAGTALAELEARR